MALWAFKFGMKPEKIEEIFKETLVYLFDVQVLHIQSYNTRMEVLGVCWPGTKLIYIAATPGKDNLRNHLEWLYKHELSHIVLWSILYSEDYEDHHKLMEEAGIRCHG